MSFLDIKFPELLEYSSDEIPIPIEFYLDVLPECKCIYLKLGYFSSKAIQVLSYSFAQFIYNGGVIKIITNHFLYNDDKELLDVNNIDLAGKFKNDLKWLNENIQGSDKHFMNCLKFLVKYNKLELIPVMLKPARMVHYKQGLFVDAEDNVLFMDGSCNFTANGLLENGETISLFRSWGSELEKNKIDKKRIDIEKIIEKKNDNYLYLKKEHILDAVAVNGEEKKIDELLKDELCLMHNSGLGAQITGIFNKHEEILNSIIKKVEVTPKFPFNSFPRDYQDEAYSNWLKNEKKGIFAMATGTGKTITALNCLLNEYLEAGNYQAIILVPSKQLLNQWYDEVLQFNFQNIILVSSDYEWRKRLNELNTNILFNKNKSFIIIATYITFAGDDFQSKSCNFPESTILIADEAHNIGMESVKKLLKKIKYIKRIALSATPKRNFDVEGNLVIEKFFNDVEPYTFSFSMEKAIKEGILCHYNYYPHIVSLNTEEMDEYIDISKKLLKFFDHVKKEYKKNPVVDSLLLKRKNILHKAENKLVAFRNIIQEHKVECGNLKYTFVYAPEGSDKDNVRLIDRYMDVFEEISPFSKAYAYTHHTDNKNEVMKNFENGYTDVLFSMKCLDEGVDIPRAEFAIFCSSTGNPRQFIQRRGRVLRTHPDKSLATIHDLIVVPSNPADSDTYLIERNMIRNELIRVIYFASLADNYYAAMDVCEEISERYELDLFALQEELRE